MQYFLLSSSKINIFQTWTPFAVVEVNDDAVAFGCLPPTHPLRRICRRVVLHRYTLAVWVVLVCLSTAISLAIQPRYDMGNTVYKTFFALQVVCTTFFWLRMLAEIIASGLFEGRHSFLRSLWNWIELAVNVFALLQVIPPTFHIRWMRVFAGARPLRFFVFCPWWKHLLVPLARGFPYICDILGVFLLCTFVFALTGVFSIGEELYQRCYITQVHNTTSELYANLQLPFLLRNVSQGCGVGFACPDLGADVTVQCVSNHTDYGNHFFSFQNVGTALLRASKVATLDMWYEDLEEVMNVKGSAAALYLVAIVVMSRFTLVVAMTVVYNAYAHLDTWFVRSAVAMVTVEDRQRKDSAVQTAPPRQFPRQLTVVRSTRAYTGDDAGDADDAEMSGECGVDGDAAPALSAVSTAKAKTTADERYARDFFRSVHVRGFWAGLRGLEQSTTVARGGEPKVRWAVALVDSLPSVVLMMVLSIGNLVLLAVVSVYTSEKHAQDMRSASAAMSIYFLVPVLLKLIGFGPTRTLMDVWNYTDVFGAVTGILELASAHIFHYRAACIIRVLRYVHAGKYVFSFQQYSYQLQCLLSFNLLWAAALLLYALVGMQLFSSAYVAGPEALVRNGDFTTLWTALLACFRASTEDVWTRYFIAAADGASVVTSSLFYLALQAFSILILFSLENSILFRGFRDAARDEDVLNFKDFPPLLLLPAMKDGGAAAETANGRAAAVDAASRTRESGQGHVEALRRRRQLQARNVFGLGSAKQLQAQRDALFLISPFHPLRRLLLRFFGSFFYLVLSTLCVAAGTVALFFERRHMSPRSEHVLHVINIVYFVVFCVEMVLKWIAYGVFSPGVHRGEGGGDDDGNKRKVPAYFREPLNWMDFAVNGTSLAGIVYAPLRVGRVLRTIRLCTTQERPNKTFLALIASLRYAAKTLPLIVFFYFAFAVGGMQIFANGLHYCSDPAVTRRLECHGQYNVTVATYTNTTLETRERVWERTAFHYDAFGPALLSVFVVSTTNHYGSLMDEAMAIVGSDRGLSYNHAGYNALFFLLVLSLLRFYALRCVAAVLAAKLRRLTMDSMETALLTLQQTRFAVSRESINYMLYLDNFLPPLPFRLSRFCHRVLMACPVNGSDPLFYAALSVLVLIACAFVAATHVYAPPWQEKMLLSVECLGVAGCGVELVLSVVAYGGTHFTKLSRLVDAVLFALMVVGVSSTTLNFFRVALLAKLIKTTNIGMQLLPAVRHAKLLCSASAVYLLVLLAYAVVGTLVFGDIAPKGLYLTEKRNFQTVIGSLLVLFDCSTLDQWQLVMYACFTGARCRSDPAATCGHTYAAVVYFVTFVIAANMLATQLVYAAMVNAFTVPFYVDVIEPFLQVRRTWLKYAGAENLKCEFSVFLRFLPLLPPSLTDGLTNEKGNESSMIAFLSSLRLPLDNQLCLTYRDLLRGLAYRKYKIDLARSGAEAYRRAALLSLTAGEHYGQLVRQRYCDEITRLAQTKLDAIHLGDAEDPPVAAHNDVGEHAAFRGDQDDYTVPKSAFPIPASNVFLYSFPGESNERAVVSPPP